MNREYRVIDVDALDHFPEDEARRTLFLDEHPELDGYWVVMSYDAAWKSRLGDTVGPHNEVVPFSYDAFAAMAKEQGYSVAFLTDPSEAFAWLDTLNGPVGVSINSTMDRATDEGFLPFQAQGVNFAKHQRGAVFNWSTGTGKTVGACGLTKWHAEQGNYDLALFVVKAHNKINTQRALKGLVDLDSVILEGGTVTLKRGSYNKRDRIYAAVDEAIERGESQIMVMNYETFRNDKLMLMELVEGRKLWVVFDEMPTKLKNRTTQLYKAVAETLYRSFVVPNKGKGKGKPLFVPEIGKERPSELRGLMLSATPIENSPEDWFNCVRLLDPSVYGSVTGFLDEFMYRRDKWGNPIWIESKLPLIGARAVHITHQVDKRDPDIAEQFPKIRRDEIMLELHPSDVKLYHALADEYEKLRDDELSMLKDTELLAAIGVLENICSNPLIVLNSAEQHAAYLEDLHEFQLTDPTKGQLERWIKKHREGSEVAYKLVQKLGRDKFDDKVGNEIRSAKLQAVKDLLADGEKAVMFTRLNDTLVPILSERLTEWGINHVTYTGTMSAKQKQAAEDKFKSDPDVQLFLASDSGSDSINLEVASLVVHFDLPWKWSTMEQRENRIHRITSEFESVRFVTLMIANSVEERRKEIIGLKEYYHIVVLKGDIAEQSQEMRKTGLIYILTNRKGLGDDA